MAQAIHPKSQHRQKAKPVRRVWIPKLGKKDERRPLGMPILVERAQQTLVKLALEPAWEAVFEENSYGFRPGRSCHDAIGAIFNGMRFKSKFVLDADIKGCFDNIDQKALLQKLKIYPQLRHLIRGWLKAGVLERVDFTPTETGTPQGGPLSPLLANIALHGIEKAAANVCTKQKGQPILIRYADDFVILHADKEILERATKAVTEHLKDMGLWLSPKKTRVTHTLTSYEGNVGFDFLGFSVRQFPVGKTPTGKNTQGKPLGFKTLITPSRDAIKRHTLQMKLLIRKRKSAPQRAVISAINPVIRGWANYYKWVVCSKAFHACDHNTFRQLARWEQARHLGKSKRWVKDKYSIPIGRSQRFGTYIRDKDGNSKAVYVRYHTETQSQNYAKVRGSASPYDGNHIYWSQRLKQHPLMKSERAKLLALV